MVRLKLNNYPEIKNSIRWLKTSLRSWINQTCMIYEKKGNAEKTCTLFMLRFITIS